MGIGANVIVWACVLLAIRWATSDRPLLGYIIAAIICSVCSIVLLWMVILIFSGKYRGKA